MIDFWKRRSLVCILPFWWVKEVILGRLGSALPFLLSLGHAACKKSAFSSLLGDGGLPLWTMEASYPSYLWMGKYPGLTTGSSMSTLTWLSHPSLFSSGSPQYKSEAWISLSDSLFLKWSQTWKEKKGWQPSNINHLCTSIVWKNLRHMGSPVA